MPLASWVGNERRGEAVGIDIDRLPDSIQSAPGWRVLGNDFWTLVQPVAGPVHDPAVVKAVQSFDPGAIPMWRKQRYLPPRSTSPVLFSHLAFGRRVRFPRRELALFHVEMPFKGSYPVPNELLIIWEFFDNRLLYEGGPGGIFPSDMRIFHYMREDYLKGDKKGAQRLAEREREINDHKAGIRKSRADENAYKQRHLDAYVERQLAAPGDTLRAYRAYQARNRALRHQRKPFVHVTGVN